MLKSAALRQVLQQSVNNGVKSAIVVNPEGSLVAAVGEDKASKTVGAVLSNIWNDYDDTGRTFMGATDMKVLMFECEDGKIAVTRSSKLILCLYADNSVEFGLLKLKLEKLSSYLEEPFKRIFG
eukprot:GILK01003074.1.p1 GENE.GILK01003074.1~~GILK01003074.1.p1  ORF type:complete len:124 (-),score=18.47 GILK01003074.1:72-443(-)